MPAFCGLFFFLVNGFARFLTKNILFLPAFFYFERRETNYLRKRLMIMATMTVTRPLVTMDTLAIAPALEE